MRRPSGPPLLACVLLSTTLSAQQYGLRTLSLEEGLPSAVVNALCEDQEGFLWVGTDQGAARSEGLHFETIGPPQGSDSKQVSALTCGPDGKVWIGYADGTVVVWDQGRITRISNEKTSPVRSIVATTAGTWWASRSAGVAYWHDGVVQKFGIDGGLGSMHVNALARMTDGRVVAGTDSGLFVYGGQRWGAAGADHVLDGVEVTAIHADSMGLLVGTEQGYFELDTALHWLPLADRLMGSYPIALPNARIFATLRARNGDLWFGTLAGMVHLSRSSGHPTMKVIRESNGLGHDLVRCLLQDRSGAIWAGTAFGGITKFTSDAFMHFTERDGLLSRTVSSIHRTADDLLWIGTVGGGVACWNGTKLRVYGPEDGLSDPFVLSLGEDAQGYLLVGTASQGLFRYTGERFARIPASSGLDARRLLGIQLDPEGRTWIGTDKGLYVDPGDGAYLHVEGLTNNVNRVFTTGDTLWAATTKGLYLLPTRTLPWRLRRQQQLPAVVMTSVVRDPAGNLWIGTESHGVYRFNNGRVDSISTTNGLGSDAVEQVVLDAQDNIWLGTRRGIDMLELDVLQEQVIDIRHFGADEGFNGVECFRNAGMLDTDSALWFGTMRGATRYDPSQVLEDPLEPLIHLTDLRLFYEHPDWKPWCNSTDRHGLPVELALPYDKNHLTFVFTGISLAYPEKVRYRFILENYDPDWSLITATDRVTYTNIPPGEYVFKVMARNGSGIWTEQPATYAFTIAPPFWQTNLFRVGSGATLLLSFFGFVSMRTRRLKLDRERLERTVKERTLELATEKERSEELLRNILPASTAEELKTNGRAEAHRYPNCTVLFSDFKGFTTFSGRMDSDTLVSELHHYFGLFDRLCDRYSVEKIKTIGDAYMCASGVPIPHGSHALNAVLMAFAMIDAVERSNRERREKAIQEWPIRIGLHTGPVVAGVVGEKKFAYDIWGDTVNLASRMESNGEAGKVNISGAVYAQVMDYIEAQPRGPVKVKGKGEVQMYFALRLKPEFSADDPGLFPNTRMLAVREGSAIRS